MSIWFGDGGAGKSVLALYEAGHLAQQRLRVLYLDWELEQGEHRLRYEQLFGAAMPASLYYWRCDRPLPQISDAIRRTIRKHRIDYVVVDSIAFACGGGPESADTATVYTNHVRSFGVGSLHVAHMTKSGDAAKMKPFGSIFWHDSARSSWYIEATKPVQRNGVTETDLTLRHRKSNFGPVESEARRLKFIAEPDRGRICLANRFVALDGKTPSVPQRIKQHIAAGDVRRVDDLPEAMPDVKPDTLMRKVRSLKAEGEIIEAADGTLSVAAA